MKLEPNPFRQLNSYLASFNLGDVYNARISDRVVSHRRGIFELGVRTSGMTVASPRSRSINQQWYEVNGNPSVFQNGSEDQMTNFIQRRPALVFGAVLVVFVTFTLPPSLYALPEKSVIDYYYSGCDALTYLGEEGVDCEGHHPDTYDGSTPFKWIWHSEERCWENHNCGDFCTTSTYYIEYCETGGYRIVSATDFWNANCSC